MKKTVYDIFPLLEEYSQNVNLQMVWLYSLLSDVEVTFKESPEYQHLLNRFSESMQRMIKEKKESANP
jgi:hypothetical protein